MKQNRHIIIGFTAACVLYAVYMYVMVNPSLYLIRRFGGFFTDAYFFRSYWDFPGNPVEYVSNCITQFYRFPIVASALIAAVAGIVYLAGITAWRKEKYAHWLAAIPVIVLMFMHNDYRHSIRLDLDAAALLAALSLIKMSFRNAGLQYLVFPVALAAILYLNGVFTALLFTALSVIAALCDKKCVTAAVMIAETLIVAAAAWFAIGLNVHDLTREIIDISRIYTFRYYPFVLYALILLLPVVAPVSGKIKLKTKALYINVSVVAAVVVALILTLNREEKNGLSVQHYAINEQWDTALRYAQKCKYPDLDAVHFTNEALYQTGKIYDDLFLYNQSFGANGLMSVEITNYSGILPNQDIFMRLGALSLSIVWGTEATNVYGANSYVLKNLAKAYLAGGYIVEARKVLSMLDHTLFDKGWAQHYGVYANDTSLISRDAELMTYRQAQAPIAVVSTQSVLMNLYLLAKDSKPNKMAYDYLVIASLLNHRPEYFASYISGLKDYGYSSIPKLYLEGLIYYTLYDAQLPIDVSDYTFDRDVIMRFDSFRRDLMQAAGRNPKQVKAAMERSYKDTYWYYLLFSSGLSDKEKVEIFNRMTM